MQPSVPVYPPPRARLPQVNWGKNAAGWYAFIAFGGAEAVAAVRALEARVGKVPLTMFRGCEGLVPPDLRMLTHWAPHGLQP